MKSATVQLHKTGALAKDAIVVRVPLDDRGWPSQHIECDGAFFYIDFDYPHDRDVWTAFQIAGIYLVKDEDKR